MASIRDVLEKIDIGDVITPGQGYIVFPDGKTAWIGIACDDDMKKKAEANIGNNVFINDVIGQVFFFLPARKDNL